MKPAKHHGNAATAIIKTISPFMSWVCCRNDIQYYIAANKQQSIWMISRFSPIKKDLVYFGSLPIL